MATRVAGVVMVMVGEVGVVDLMDLLLLLAMFYVCLVVFGCVVVLVQLLCWMSRRLMAVWWTL
jgi:Na+/H+-dicarboxylate symporter